jgi:hypothetical protein
MNGLKRIPTCRHVCIVPVVVEQKEVATTELSTPDWTIDSEMTVLFLQRHQPERPNPHEKPPINNNRSKKVELLQQPAPQAFCCQLLECKPCFTSHNAQTSKQAAQTQQQNRITNCTNMAGTNYSQSTTVSSVAAAPMSLLSEFMALRTDAEEIERQRGSSAVVVASDIDQQHMIYRSKSLSPGLLLLPSMPSPPSSSSRSPFQHRHPCRVLDHKHKSLMSSTKASSLSPNKFHYTSRNSTTTMSRRLQQHDDDDDDVIENYLLAASPLTSRSYNTMAREFDRETLRMKNLINESRRLRTSLHTRGQSSHDHRQQQQEEQHCHHNIIHHESSHGGGGQTTDQYYDLNSSRSYNNDEYYDNVDGEEEWSQSADSEEFFELDL